MAEATKRLHTEKLCHPFMRMIYILCTAASSNHLALKY